MNAAAKRSSGHGLPGFFVTFEGGEGTGKSTQVAALAKSLTASGETVVTTREPGGSPGAEIVREALLGGHLERFGPEVEAMMFSMARADHLDCVIRPALEHDSIVLCDRFLDSTRAYQGTAATVAEELVAGLEGIAVGDLMPDLTILLDLPAERGLARARKRAGATTDDRFEKEDVAVHEARRQAFLAIAQRETERFAVIDADRPIAVIQKEIAERVARAIADARTSAKAAG